MAAQLNLVEGDNNDNPFVSSGDEAIADLEAATDDAVHAVADAPGDGADEEEEEVATGARARRLIWSHTMNAYVMELFREKVTDGVAIRLPQFTEIADKVGDQFSQYAHLLNATSVESKYKREKKRYAIWKTLKAFSGCEEPKGDTVLVASEQNLRSVEAKFSVKVGPPSGHCRYPRCHA